jgi:preprotein translocase subunit SecD
MHKKSVRGRILLLITFTLLSLVFLLPSLPVWTSLPPSVKKVLPAGAISLGLDLRGGMSVTLQVMEEKAISGTGPSLMGGLHWLFISVRTGPLPMSTVSTPKAAYR